MVSDEYSIGELANLGGVSRRTVRYYVQEGLIPPPHGLGRGARYDRAHLEQLLRVKALQERGLTLDEVRRAIGSKQELPASEVVPEHISRSHWTRVEILPGLELHVSSRHRIPSPAQLDELVHWCRRHFHQ
ncbi:MAG TPA: MerR family transcriptional regulator, partial [Vicinamibacteria bacterium]|nr:MerR family transcriptional regulator [Vicinamibacteria bacterium]